MFEKSARWFTDPGEEASSADDKDHDPTPCEHKIVGKPARQRDRALAAEETPRIPKAAISDFDGGAC